MKKATIYLMSLVLVLGMGMASAEKVHATPHGMGVSFQVFYNELSPFGDWVMDPNHGYVWIPYVDRSFQPYVTNGYWSMTNFGNTWVSHFEWGWAPFHYGRWFWSDFYGWAWVPGYEWGPAWVSWRTGGGFYGWAPLGPGMHVGVNIMIPARHWVFLPQRRFRHRHFHRFFVPHYNVVNVYNRTTIINNTYVYNNNTYFTGPSRREIQRVTGRNVPVYAVNNATRPGRTLVQNNNINMYRPEISNSRSANQQARPSRAFTAEEYGQRSARQGRSTVQNGRVQNQPNREAQATPSRNAQQGNRNGAVNSSSRTGESANGSAVRSTAPNSRQNNPAVRSNGYSRQDANPAVRSNSNVRQTAPAVINNSSRSGRNTNVGTSSNNRQTAPAVRSGTSNRQSNPAVRSNTNTRKSSPAVRSNSSNRQSSPSVRSSSSSSSRSSSGTVNRSGNGNNNRSSGTTSSRSSNNRGGRGN